MMSSRYLPVIAVLLAMALVPTVIHSYAGATVSDGRATADIPGVLAGFTSRPSDRNATWGKRRFDSDDWMERRYTASDREITLTVVRTYDLKAVYHHPELAVAYGPSFAPVVTERLSDRPEIPLHVLRPSIDARTLGMYVLHYDDTFVDSPIWFQVKTSGKLLFSGRRPMTLFFVTDDRAPEGADLQRLPSTQVLLAAIDRFVASGSRP